MSTVIDTNNPYVLPFTGAQAEKAIALPNGDAGLTDTEKSHARSNIGMDAVLAALRSEVVQIAADDLANYAEEVAAKYPYAIIALTQAEYDALTAKDSATLYFVIEE